MTTITIDNSDLLLLFTLQVKANVILVGIWESHLTHKERSLETFLSLLHSLLTVSVSISEADMLHSSSSSDEVSDESAG